MGFLKFSTNRIYKKILFSFQALIATATPKPKPKPLKQNWGHVSVRPGAFMFYWAYFRPNYSKYPLILWLQGGPGISSTGVGNFMEIGPFDVNSRKKPFGWTNAASILFVDSPVGTGFSYVNDTALIPKNASAAAKDLAIFLKGFYNQVAEALSCPLYVFGEGYGAKVGAHFTVLLNDMIKKKKIDIKLAGVSLGDAWLSPVESAESYGQFLYSNSLIDNVGYSPISTQADKIQVEVNKGSFTNASRIWTELIQDIQEVTNGVNLYNILNPLFQHNASQHYKLTHHQLDPFGMLVEPFIKELSELMNGEVKKNLKISENLTWCGQCESVWKAMQDDFMKPAVREVELLLNKTKLPVMVYNGQLDLLVPSIGSECWAQEMKWAGAKKWAHSKREPILNSMNHTVGYSKKFKNFSFYWLLRTGHMTPLDAPESSFGMMKKFIGIK